MVMLLVAVLVVALCAALYARKGWCARDLPDMAGRVVVVTGASVGGLGFQTALELAARGATVNTRNSRNTQHTRTPAFLFPMRHHRAGVQVVTACRDEGKLAAAAAVIRSAHPGARVEPLLLDLASLDSVRRFAALVRARFPAVHVLVNNAGVMAPPFARTVEGFEMQVRRGADYSCARPPHLPASQLGTNHLGHFLLVAELLPALRAGGTAGQVRAECARVALVVQSQSALAAGAHREREFYHGSPGLAALE